MPARHLAVGSFVALTLCAGLPASARGKGGALSAEPHPPIVVTGDEGPAGLVLGRHPLTGDPIYRPGSGVVAGRGSATDPYVIRGWSLPSIHVRGTTAHLEIRANVATGLPDSAPLATIHVEESANVRVVDNDVTSAQYGVLFTTATDVVAEGNRVTGGIRGIASVAGRRLSFLANEVRNATNAIQVDNGHDLLVRSNQLIDTGFAQGGVQMTGVTNALVADNRIVRHHTGVYVVSTTGLVVRDNQIGSFSRGINPWFSPQAVVEGNDIDGPANGGILFAETSNSIVRDNRVRGPLIGIQIAGPGSGTLVTANEVSDSDYGIVLSGGGPNQLRENTVTGSGSGLAFSDTTGSTAHGNLLQGNEVAIEAIQGVTGLVLRENEIVGNGIGVDNKVEEPVDARQNWWGCAQGPGFPGCDHVNGPVQIDPWLPERPTRPDG